MAGKEVRGMVYVHISALESSSIPPELARKSLLLPEGWSFEVIRWNANNNDVSFISSPDWNESPEPLSGDSYRITSANEVVFRRASTDNPQIFHDKHLFVNEDYPGFDVKQARKRSEVWNSLKPDKSRIGRLKYWNASIVPLIEKIEKE